MEFAANASFDVAILDVQLLDGSSRPLAELLAARNIPFTFASGYGPEGIPERFRNRPVLQKPFEAEELRRCIEGLLSPKMD
ncbi:hypothetical protein [Bradyrhizobium sp. U531]|uniref:hypothetical protein n=1 Tax=Bradyrhizobium sp. U531 TaxID=3053458 RepID=UPI003F683482